MSDISSIFKASRPCLMFEVIFVNNVMILVAEVRFVYFSQL